MSCRDLMLRPEITALLQQNVNTAFEALGRGSKIRETALMRANRSQTRNVFYLYVTSACVTTFITRIYVKFYFPAREFGERERIPVLFERKFLDCAHVYVLLP